MRKLVGLVRDALAAMMRSATRRDEAINNLKAMRTTEELEQLGRIAAWGASLEDVEALTQRLATVGYQWAMDSATTGDVRVPHGLTVQKRTNGGEWSSPLTPVPLPPDGKRVQYVETPEGGSK